MKREKIKISVIVPVYNVEDYIRECLDSIINQTYRNLEIILVDDGSTDNSGTICDEYGKKDQRITVIHKENGGLVSARKVGVMAATGEYVTFVDSDDWIVENAYEEIEKILEQYHSDVVACDFIKDFSNLSTERKQLLAEGFYTKDKFLVEVEKIIKEAPFFCPGIHVTLWSKVFKKELLKKYQLRVNDEIRVGEDIAVVFPLILGMENIYIVNSSYYHYRVRKSSICWEKDENTYNRYLKLVEGLNLVRNDIRDNAYKEKINRYLIYVYYFYLIICAPKHCFIDTTKFLLFPEVRHSDRVIIYGKGVFANSIIKYIEQIDYCKVVDWIDKSDIARVGQISEKSYEYIVIAITDCLIVQSSRLLLESIGIDKNKILCICKENLTLEALPMEVQRLTRSTIGEIF